MRMVSTETDALIRREDVIVKIQESLTANESAIIKTQKSAYSEPISKRFVRTEENTLGEGNLTFPQPWSLEWRISQAILYVVGGAGFLLAPIFYFPCCTNYGAGGWIFTISSGIYLLADFQEWWMNNRIGCCMDSDYRKDYEGKVGKHFGPQNSVWGIYLRAERGMSHFLAVIGSTLYLVGSILFIPGILMVYWGTMLFVWGSALIILASTIKLYTQGMTNPHDLSSRKFRMSNYDHDFFLFVSEVLVLIGALFYLIGSVYFLPDIDTSTEILLTADWYWVIGGALFFLSSLVAAYRYRYKSGPDDLLEDSSGPIYCLE